MGNTIKELSQITDTGLFERLATAVLRCSADFYKSIIHTGVNVDGVTIKDPFDGITFVKNAKLPHMIAIHHTITKSKDLEAKWLLDPSKVKQRSKTKTKPIAGDLIKTAEEYKKFKKDIPNLKCTLVLTTNKKVGSVLRVEVEKIANKFGIDIDFWDASRISDFLELDPNGQYIRYKYLGITQERLSKQYLNELSEISISNLPFFDNKDQWIDRKLDEELSSNSSLGLNFIVGESGQGKTVSCLKYLKNHIQNKGYGIIVLPDEIENANSIEDLIFNHLSRLNKHLIESSGDDSLSYTTLDNPFIILVEDINKFNNSIEILGKMANWHTQYFEGFKKSKVKEFWEILCPLWTRNLFNEKDILKNIPVISCTSFSAEEGTKAVLKKYDVEGKTITSLKAKELASDMGFDPFIIGLLKAEEEINPKDVIKKFIFDKLETLSQNNDEFISTEYYSLLKDLVLKIYINHITELTWNDIENFCFDSSEKRMLKKLSSQGQIFKLVGDSDKMKVKFRHDRIQDWIASLAITDKFNDINITDNILSEPYYARIIGLVLNESNIKTKNIEKIKSINPISLFYSLKGFRKAKTKIQKVIVSNIIYWLQTKGIQNKSNKTLILHCLEVLSETDSEHVIEILRKIQDRKNWYYPEAGFRNGDINLGIELCSHFEPGMSNVSYELLIQHVISKYHDNLVEGIKKKLIDVNIKDKHLSGVLRICGYLANTKLSEFLKDSWDNLIRKRQRLLLGDYFWACAQCCGNQPSKLLKPIFDMWSSLPSKSKKNGIGSERDRFASNVVRWAFEKYIPQNAIEYFISKTKRKYLERPLTHMLHSIDHPDVIIYIVKYLAKIRKEIEGTKRYYSFLSTPVREWKRKQEIGKPMSKESRNVLLELWTNKKNDKYLRKQAFLFWEATQTKQDLGILKKYNKDKVLKNVVLKARLERRDASAIKQLLVKIKTDSIWWWNARNIWSEELTIALDKDLNKLSNKLAQNSKYQLTNGESIFVELIIRLPIELGEKLLKKYWDNLKKCNDFILVALYIATDKMVELVTIVIDNHKNPSNIFKFIDQHYGIMTLDHPGITRIKQLKVLIPFLNYLDIFYVYEFWDLCNKRKWFAFRREYLDPILKSTKWDIYLTKKNIFKTLDEKINRVRLSFFNDWINDYKKTGVTAEEIIQIVFEWVNLQDKTNSRVLNIAFQTVWYIGNRADFIHLRDDIYKEINTFDEEFENKYYAIRRRTLK